MEVSVYCACFYRDANLIKFQVIPKLSFPMNREWSGQVGGCFSLVIDDFVATRQLSTLPSSSLVLARDNGEQDNSEGEPRVSHEKLLDFCERLTRNIAIFHRFPLILFAPLLFSPAPSPLLSLSLSSSLLSAGGKSVLEPSIVRFTALALVFESLPELFAVKTKITGAYVKIFTGHMKSRKKRIIAVEEIQGDAWLEKVLLRNIFPEYLEIGEVSRSCNYQN